MQVFFFSTATFFFWTALYLYVPILPVYTESLGASLSLVGAVVASYAIPQMLLRIPIGILFDAVSQRKLLPIGGIMMAVLGAIGLGLAPSPWFLFAARSVTGIGAATWVTFTVYFAAYYPQGEMRKAISIINFVNKCALVSATLCGGIIAEAWGTDYAFWGGAVLGCCGLLVLLSVRGPGMVPTEPFSTKSFKKVASFPPLLTVSLLGVLCFFASWATLFTFVPVYAVQIGASGVDLGIITMLCLSSQAVASLLVIPLSKRCSNSLIILIGAIVMGISLIVLPQVANLYLLELVMVVFGLGVGLVGTTLMSLSVHFVDIGQRATAMGIFQATYALGMFLGPLIAGFLADNLGLAAVFYICTALSLLVAGLAYLPAISKARVIQSDAKELGGGA